jgi:hypothetical protein
LNGAGTPHITYVTVVIDELGIAQHGFGTHDRHLLGTHGNVHEVGLWHVFTILRWRKMLRNLRSGKYRDHA